jgi:hypothetical protein
MLQWLGNVVRGRYAHWNDANILQVNILLGKAAALPQIGRIVIRECLLTSNSLVNCLLGPDQGKNRFLDIDLLSVGSNQFLQLHRIQIAGMAGLFAGINPAYRLALLEGLGFVTGGDPVATAVFEELSLESPDLQSAGRKLWDLVSGVIGKNLSALHLPAQLGWFPYTSLFGKVASLSFEEITNELSMMSPPETALRG